MAIAPQKFREITFQILYSYDIGPDEGDEIVDLLVKELAVSKKTVLRAQELARAIRQVCGDIDARIARVSKSYEFDRIQSVERNILRLGVYELLVEASQPPKVVISEALRLCRKFTSPEAASFVNAILDVLYQEALGEAARSDALHSVSKKLEESEKRARQAAMEREIGDDEPSA